MTAGIGRVVGQVFLGVMHGDVAPRQHVVELPAAQSGQMRRLAQGQEALGVETDRQFQEQPGLRFGRRQAQGLSHFIRDFERHSHAGNLTYSDDQAKTEPHNPRMATMTVKSARTEKK
jgi:hypothetical protein